MHKLDNLWVPLVKEKKKKKKKKKKENEDPGDEDTPTESKYFPNLSRYTNQQQ